MITTKITIPEHLAEYARGRYDVDDDGAVHFPPATDIYLLIYDLTSKRPADVPVDKGNLKIALPAPADGRKAGGKQPAIYNYLSAKAARIVANKLQLLMWSELHEMMEIGRHRDGEQLQETAYRFLNRNMIESLSIDAVLKNYQRWRARVRQRVKRERDAKKR